MKLLMQRLLAAFPRPPGPETVEGRVQVQIVAFVHAERVLAVETEIEVGNGAAGEMKVLADDQVEVVSERDVFDPPEILDESSFVEHASADACAEVQEVEAVKIRGRNKNRGLPRPDVSDSGTIFRSSVTRGYRDPAILVFAPHVVLQHERAILKLAKALLSEITVNASGPGGLLSKVVPLKHEALQPGVFGIDIMCPKPEAGAEQPPLHKVYLSSVRIIAVAPIIVPERQALTASHEIIVVQGESQVLPHRPAGLASQSDGIRQMP